MNSILQNLLVTLFAVSGIFWGLMPREVHCSVIKHMSANCLPHWAHLTIGLVSFTLAIFFAQYDYFIN
jgi:hypothetical protein